MRTLRSVARILDPGTEAYRRSRHYGRTGRLIRYTEGGDFLPQGLREKERHTMNNSELRKVESISTFTTRKESLSTRNVRGHLSGLGEVVGRCVISRMSD